MYKASTIFILILLGTSCQSNSEVSESPSTEVQTYTNKVIIPEVGNEPLEDDILFYDSYSETEILESRQEMSDILARIGAAHPTDSEFNLINVMQTQDGYTGYDLICDERFNGSLRFLIGSGNDELEEYYGFHEPFFEFQGQDLFLYAIEEIFVQPDDEKIKITIRDAYFDNESGNYYTDMADPTGKIEIWQDVEYGTVALYSGDYYLDSKNAANLNTSPCPEFEH